MSNIYHDFYFRVGSMPEQVRNTSRRIAELRMRLRRALLTRHRLNHHRHQDHYGDSSNETQSSRNHLLTSVENDDVPPVPILVDDVSLD